MSKVNNYIEKATQNINEDRATTKVLLMELMKYIQGASERHREVGIVAAKYVETLQRSNEQLVKLATLLMKEKDTGYVMTSEDKEELFDMLSDMSEKEEKTTDGDK